MDPPYRRGSISSNSEESELANTPLPLRQAFVSINGLDFETAEVAAQIWTTSEWKLATAFRSLSSKVALENKQLAPSPLLPPC